MTDEEIAASKYSQIKRTVSDLPEWARLPDALKTEFQAYLEVVGDAYQSQENLATMQRWYDKRVSGYMRDMSSDQLSTGWCSICDTAPVPTASLTVPDWKVDFTLCEKCATRLQGMANFMQEQRYKANRAGL